MMPREPEKGQTSEVERAAAREDLPLEQALTEEKERAQSYLANWQRAQADFINYRRRSEQEKEELSQFARSALILNLLPALDDLERALASIPADIAQHSWVEGIRLIGRKLRGILETEGLSAIQAVGEPFDPRVHEAIRQEKGEEGIVLEEAQKGYKFRDRVIRPSKVVVGSGEGKASD